MRHTASAKKNLRLRSLSNRPAKLRRAHLTLVVCVSNKGYPASLERRKIYEAISDSDAGQHHLLRIIDESGESYLYPEKFFIPVKLPDATLKALTANH